MILQNTLQIKSIQLIAIDRIGSDNSLFVKGGCCCSVEFFETEVFTRTFYSKSQFISHLLSGMSDTIVNKHNNLILLIHQEIVDRLKLAYIRGKHEANCPTR